MEKKSANFLDADQEIICIIQKEDYENAIIGRIPEIKYNKAI